MALFWRAWTVKSWCPKWFWNMRRLVIFHLSIWKPFVLFFFIKSRAQFLLNCCEPKYQKSREAVWIKVLCKAWLHDRASCSSAGASRVLTKTVSGDGLRERSQIAGRCLWEIVQFNPFCPGAHPGSFEDLQGKKKLNWKKKGGYNARGLVRWCRESKWPLSVLLTELKYISNTLETSVEKLECAFHLQFISSLEKITLCSLAPLTVPCCILPNHCLPPLLCIASDLSVSSPRSGSCLTCCYFPFHFYSLLWCLHPPLVHLWFLSPLPTSVHLFIISLQWLMFSKTVSVSSFRKPLHTFVMFRRSWLQVVGELLLFPCRCVLVDSSMSLRDRHFSPAKSL